MGKHKMSVHLVASCAVKYVFSLTFQLVKCQRVKNLYGTELVVCVCVFFFCYTREVYQAYIEYVALISKSFYSVPDMLYYFCLRLSLTS